MGQITSRGLLQYKVLGAMLKASLRGCAVRNNVVQMGLAVKRVYVRLTKLFFK